MDKAQVEKAFVLTCAKAVSDMMESFLSHPFKKEVGVRAQIELLNSAVLSARRLGGLPAEVAIFSNPELTVLRKDLVAMMTLGMYDQVWVRVRQELELRGVAKKVVEQINHAQLAPEPKKI